MLAATELLRPGPTRIGSLGHLALPRTVRLRSLLAWVAGGAGGLLVGAVADAVIGGVGPLAAGLFGGAALAHLAVNVEPLPGENLLTWLHLTSGSHHRRVAMNGTRTRVVVCSLTEPVPAGASQVARAGDRVAWAVPARRGPGGGALVAVGTCPLDTVIVGTVRIVGGTVDVAPGSVDDRGASLAAGRRRISPAP
jgi:hypothetical protein